MDDQELLQYSRQIMLPEFGMHGQQALQSARIAIIGMGGLGNPAALYLASSGVGHLTLVDFDRVEVTNLQRQTLYSPQDIGKPKVEVARESLVRANPVVNIDCVNEKLDLSGLTRLCTSVDAVIDACDNFATRFMINQACVETGTPLVSGAAVRMEGQISVFDLRRADSPCYRCLYQDIDDNDMDQTCAANGILAPVVGTIGMLQALETIKLLTGIGDSLSGRLILFDAKSHEWRSMKLRRDPACPVCATRQLGA